MCPAEVKSVTLLKVSTKSIFHVELAEPILSVITVPNIFTVEKRLDH